MTAQPDDAKIVAHTFGCGHATRSTRRNVRLHPDSCADCRRVAAETASAERRRDRRRARRAAEASEPPRPTPTPEQRAAQRVVVSLSQPRVGRLGFDCNTLDLGYREAHSDWGVTLQEVAEHFDVLGVEYRVEVGQACAPGARAEAVLFVPPAGQDVLFYWVPSLVGHVRAALDEAAAALLPAARAELDAARMIQATRG